MSVPRYCSEVEPENMPDVVAVVRCKDCKHRPYEPDWLEYENGFDIEFPDTCCPCQCCEDRFYSWFPTDEWFCANGERKDGDGDG